MTEEMSFKDKIKTLQVIAGGRTRDTRSMESRHPDGYRLKTTTEGDPVNGSVTHIEHAVGDRVDATVSPATLSLSMAVNQKG